MSETNNGSGSGPTDNSLVGKLRENLGGVFSGAKGAKVEVEALKKKLTGGGSRFIDLAVGSELYIGLVLNAILGRFS